MFKRKITLCNHKLLHLSEMFSISLLYTALLDHPLVVVREQNPWEVFEKHFGELYCLDNGPPGFPIRMMMGLLLLKHVRVLPDEEVVDWCLDIPYKRYFCRVLHCRQDIKPDSSSLSRFHRCIGESVCKLKLNSTMMEGSVMSELKESELKSVTVGTTCRRIR